MNTKILTGAALALAFPGGAMAATLDAVDLAALDLGPAIVGPVGVTVDSGFDADGLNFGDFSGGALCPVGFAECLPPANPAGTIYTYVQSVTPGADPVPNDPPFPNADEMGDPDPVAFYRLGFDPAGFNGVVGYDFSEAAAAGVSFMIEADASGITWTTEDGGDWTSGETISFFFQSTQNPSGPGGVYQIGNDAFTASAAGPLPTELPVTTPIPLPAGALLFGTALLGLGLLRRKA